MKKPPTARSRPFIFWFSRRGGRLVLNGARALAVARQDRRGVRELLSKRGSMTPRSAAPSPVRRLGARWDSLAVRKTNCNFLFAWDETAHTSQLRLYELVKFTCRLKQLAIIAKKLLCISAIPSFFEINESAEV